MATPLFPLCERYVVRAFYFRFRGQRLMWKQLLQILMLAGIALGLPAYLEAAPFGGFGDSLDQAKKTDFFTWFHLTQVAQEEVAGAKVTSFKPSGEKFRELVTFKVTTAQNGSITVMEVILARAFVDSPQDGIFARDIAKSLLRTAFADGSDQEIKALTDQIEYLGTSTSLIIQHESRKPPNFRPRPPPAIWFTWANSNLMNMLRGVKR